MGRSPEAVQMPIRALAFDGESVSVTDLLADSLALTGLATLDGLTQGNMGCDQLLRNDVNCTCVHNGRGRLGRNLLRCAYSRQLLSITGAKLGHRNYRQHSYHQEHGHAGNFTAGDVSTGADGLRRSSFAATGATGATLTITGSVDGEAWLRRDKLGHRLLDDLLNEELGCWAIRAQGSSWSGTVGCTSVSLS